MSRLGVAALLALLAAHSLRADVTLRRTTTVTVGAGMPAQVQQQLQTQIASSMPPDSVTRIKGDKAYANMGALVGITDYGTSQIILLNPKTKQFSTAPLTDYIDGMTSATQALTGALPPEAQEILKNMKWDVQTRKTGASQTIQGMPAEESVIALALGMPIGQTTMTTMRMEMHLWTVQPSEVARNAALKELAGYNARSKNTMDPTVALQKLFAQMPGLGDQFRKVVTQLTETSGGVMLRMRASVFVPALAQALPQVDPTAPLMEFQSEVTEFSTAALDDSYFAVPAGYQSAPLKDLLKVMLPALPQPQPAAPQPQ